mmetsp:Transcript_122170/g.222247  ORF Transcript_122170/g.222247 Transcript_122170/m.222247 type:complete len:106 (+) Transcript_122170:27-344(+)
MSGAAFRHPPPFLNSGDSDGKHKNDVEQKSATASHLTRPCALLGDQKKVVSARADGMHEIVGRRLLRSPQDRPARYDASQTPPRGLPKPLPSQPPEETFQMQPHH